jgi:hypothetical protein
MSNGKMSRENRHALKNELESLLSSISSAPNEDLVADDELAQELKRESPYDFNQMSDQFTEKAKEITDSLFKNFVDIGIFEKNDYARHKKELDTINISNLFFQLKTLKIAIIKVMEDIAGGNTHPRLLEVMGQLQDKMASITKMQANYILFLEETYKKLNNDSPVNPDSTQIQSSDSEGKFFISVGTKNVIQNLPKSDINDDNEASTELIDPNNKFNLMRDKNIEIDDEDSMDGDEFINIQEII